MAPISLCVHSQIIPAPEAKRGLKRGLKCVALKVSVTEKKMLPRERHKAKEARERHKAKEGRERHKAKEERARAQKAHPQSRKNPQSRKMPRQRASTLSIRSGMNSIQGSIAGESDLRTAVE
jgi:hypothetical protein